MRVSEELREDYRNRGDFSILKAAEDIEAILENNNYRGSQNGKLYLKNLEKKKQKDEQFLHNIGLAKQGHQEEMDIFGSSDKNKENNELKRSRAKNKENVTLKNYKELREMAVKDLKFKISD